MSNKHLLPRLPPPADAPVVGLSLGRSMKAHLIKEGDDAYFECSIEANPAFHRVDWRHNVSARRGFLILTDFVPLVPSTSLSPVIVFFAETSLYSLTCCFPLLPPVNAFPFYHRCHYQNC